MEAPSNSSNDLLSLKNIAKFDLTAEAAIPLETRVSHSVCGRSDHSGKLHSCSKIDFEFTSECLADFHLDKNH